MLIVVIIITMLCYPRTSWHEIFSDAIHACQCVRTLIRPAFDHILIQTVESAAVLGLLGVSAVSASTTWWRRVRGTTRVVPETDSGLHISASDPATTHSPDIKVW